MKKEQMLYVGGGLLTGLLIAGLVATLSVNNDYRGMMRMMGMNTSRIQDRRDGHMGMAMNDMHNELRDRSGDDFDKTFIEMMTAHHQGAIDMAELAQAKAKHQEVKDMANEIIKAQTKEINMMVDWQEQWGYDPSKADMMMH